MASPALLDIPGVEARLLPGVRPTMVLVKRDAEGFAAEWWSATAHGWRDMSFRGQEMPKRTSLEDAMAHAARAATLGEGVRGTAEAKEREAYPLMRLHEYGPAMLRAVDDPQVAAFFEDCGRVTMAAHMNRMDIDEISTFDAHCGPDVVESFFARWPFLLVPMFRRSVRPTQAALELEFRVVRSRTTEEAAAAIVRLELRTENSPSSRWLIDSCSTPLTEQERDIALRLLMKRQEGVPAWI